MYTNHWRQRFWRGLHRYIRVLCSSCEWIGVYAIYGKNSLWHCSCFSHCLRHLVKMFDMITLSAAVVHIWIVLLEENLSNSNRPQSIKNNIILVPFFKTHFHLIRLRLDDFLKKSFQMLPYFPSKKCMSTIETTHCVRHVQPGRFS